MRLTFVVVAAAGALASATRANVVQIVGLTLGSIDALEHFGAALANTGQILARSGATVTCSAHDQDFPTVARSLAACGTRATRSSSPPGAVLHRVLTRSREDRARDALSTVGRATADRLIATRLLEDDDRVLRAHPWPKRHSGPPRTAVSPLDRIATDPARSGVSAPDGRLPHQARRLQSETRSWPARRRRSSSADTTARNRCQPNDAWRCHPSAHPQHPRSGHRHRTTNRLMHSCRSRRFAPRQHTVALLRVPSDLGGILSAHVGSLVAA